ncbi:hypothetical protein HMPREF9477_01923 [Lachnospiraceae bacterium 2_1_46FAA]|jgi:hypothetical protein|nr:hypothetical protein HMPREF9477_01923 [Lachnospiraceae bacterium 2_1_46FAA]
MGGKKKIVAILLGIVDVLLIVALVLTFFIAGNEGKSVKANWNSDFKPNASRYEEVDETKEYKADKQIAFDGKKITAADSPTEKNVTEPQSELVFPDSDKTLLTDEMINEKVNDKQTLRLAINEIYARHGYQFTSEEYINHFNQFDWYKNMTKEPDMNKVSAGFSEIEKKNVEKLQAYSDAKGWS